MELLALYMASYGRRDLGDLILACLFDDVFHYNFTFNLFTESVLLRGYRSS